MLSAKPSILSGELAVFSYIWLLSVYFVTVRYFHEISPSIDPE